MQSMHIIKLSGVGLMLFIGVIGSFPGLLTCLTTVLSQKMTEVQLHLVECGFNSNDVHAASTTVGICHGS